MYTTTLTMGSGAHILRESMFGRGWHKTSVDESLHNCSALFLAFEICSKFRGGKSFTLARFVSQF
jgi:hypothetical protein